MVTLPFKTSRKEQILLFVFLGKKTYAQFHELWVNLKIAIPRSEDFLRFILARFISIF